MDSLTAIDLFAGPGGASLGFRRAGFDIRAAVEADRTAAESYARNHPDTPLLTDDIRGLWAAQILSAARLEVGECSVVIGCPPCQGFSTQRLRGAGSDDPRNGLVLVFAELINSIRPEFFIFENVPGLLRRADCPWTAAKRILEQDYRIRERVLNAADYGIPQRRLRLTAIGSRLPVVRVRFPQRTHRDPRKPGTLPPWKTVRHAIGDLARLENGSGSEADPLHSAPHHRGATLRRFAAIPRDGGSRNSLPEELQLECHRQHDGHRDVYGRLSWDKPAGTITGGCTQPSKGRFLHPEQHRGLTLREAARLQGFPDTYTFSGAKQQIALQIGNAVPPDLAYAVARSVQRARRRLEAQQGTSLAVDPHRVLVPA